MNYRKLGKTGIQISEVSFGSWITFGNQIGNDVSERLLDIAYDHGINFFDNAETYAQGRSEEVMGEILFRKPWPRDSYMVSSKVFFGTGGQWPTQKGLSRKHVVEACHAALKRLRTDYLDLYFCHRPDPNTPIEETVWTMHNLIQQGKILYWGTSEWSAQEITEAHLVARQYNLIGPVMEQPQYNMLVRKRVENEYTRLYDTVGLGLTTWSPLASGLLTGKYNTRKKFESRLEREELSWLRERLLTDNNLNVVKRLGKLADDAGVTLPVLAIAWCLRNPHVSTVLLGASQTSQLEENLKVLEQKSKLTDSLMDEINTLLQDV